MQVRVETLDIYILMHFASQLRMERELIELFGFIDCRIRGVFGGAVVKRELGVMYIRVFTGVYAHI